MAASQLVSRLSALLHHSYKSQRECSRICLLGGQWPTPALCLTISGCRPPWLTVPGIPCPPARPDLLPVSLARTSLSALRSCLLSPLTPPRFQACPPLSSPLLSASARPRGDLFAEGDRVLCSPHALRTSGHSWRFLARRGSWGPGTGITQPWGDPGSAADAPWGSGSLSFRAPFLH